jgi:hypothetical protein
LPTDYIDSLRASYPPQLIEAYLEGRFVNLNSGCVPEFSRKLNHADRGDAWRACTLAWTSTSTRWPPSCSWYVTMRRMPSVSL